MSSPNRGRPIEFQECVIGEDDGVEKPSGQYAPVYAKLLELAKAHEEGEERKGVIADFYTASNGHRAVMKMSVWANSDGWQIVFGPPREGGKRELHMIPITEEDGDTLADNER